MKRFTLALALTAFCAIFANSAVASTVTSTQKAALQAQVSADMPAAQAQVAQAASTGTLPALVSEIASMPHPANATTPYQYALMQAMKSYSKVSNNQSTANTLTSSISSPSVTATYCWFVGSHIGNRNTFAEAGIAVAWVEKDHNYWCGNGYSITQNGLGFYHGQWAQTPWCEVITNDLHGWDGPNYSWAHGGIWAHYGEYTPWITCATFTGGHAVVRIAGNGHFDYYDDYGF